MTRRVRILSYLAGDPRQVGEELDLPTDEAENLVRQGRAEYVRRSAIETPERAAGIERTVKGRSRGRSHA